MCSTKPVVAEKTERFNKDVFLTLKHLRVHKIHQVITKSMFMRRNRDVGLKEMFGELKLGWRFKEETEWNIKVQYYRKWSS